MTIKTKYNVCQTVWVNDDGGPSGYSIISISIKKYMRKKPAIMYELGWGQKIFEEDLFPSYRAAKAALKGKYENNRRKNR